MLDDSAIDSEENGEPGTSTGQQEERSELWFMASFIGCGMWDTDAAYSLTTAIAVNVLSICTQYRTQGR